MENIKNLGTILRKYDLKGSVHGFNPWNELHNLKD